MTYREKLQSLIESCENTSAVITGMRDYTNPEKKKFLNSAKGAMFDVLEQLEKLDNSLTSGEAASKY